MTYEQERRLVEAAGMDSFYQELLRQCETLTPEYARIRSGLSEEDQEELDQYISVCEEMEYRRTCLAYALGTKDGAKSRTAQFVTD